MKKAARVVNVVFVRAGMTKSGQEYKHIGLNNESLLAEEKSRLRCRELAEIYPSVQRVYTSKLARCIETANLVYPYLPALISDNLESIDYGRLEGANYGEVASNAGDEGIILAEDFIELPDGESVYRFAARVNMAFEEIVRESVIMGKYWIGVITHENVIALILRKRVIPRAIRQGIEVYYGGGIVFEYNYDSGMGIIKKIF